MNWIRRKALSKNINVTDVTEDYGVLGVMGPNSRDLLQSLSEDSFETRDFPFGWSRIIEIKGYEIRATRVSFVGELGWELMVPKNIADQFFDILLSAANQFDIGLAGLFTLECCRLEKGFVHWGHEMGPEENPYEANLGFTVRSKKDGGFLGLSALKVAATTPLEKKLYLFEVKRPWPLLLHDEPIYFKGEWVGRTTSGGMGFRTDKALCFGYIKLNNHDVDYCHGRVFEVKVAGEYFKMTALSEPPYDAKSQILKG